MNVKINCVSREKLLSNGWREAGDRFYLRKPVWSYNGATTLYIDMAIITSEKICQYGVYQSNGELYRTYYCNQCDGEVIRKINTTFKKLFSQLKTLGIISKKGVVRYA